MANATAVVDKELPEEVVAPAVVSRAGISSLSLDDDDEGEGDDVLMPQAPRERSFTRYSTEGSIRLGSSPRLPPDLSAIKPNSPLGGSRSVSTSMRLRRQGFRESNTASFAVRSIRRGSDSWKGVIRPFVAHLAFRSLEFRRFQSEVSFRPYTCEAAVLFVDLSDYSKITRLIAHRGAHALSSIVNAYFGKLLDVVRRYGGDVIKFAGDAVIVVWEGTKYELELNILTAAQCAVDMQEQAGSHPVDGTDLVFRIHCGLCAGPLESEIFAASNHVNMQRLFHAVGGASLNEISVLVDIAKSGEICASEQCYEVIGKRGTFRNVRDEEGNLFRLLETVDYSQDLRDDIDLACEQALSDRVMRRSKNIEEEFIHPSVLRLLGHGGLSATQIAQMRNLCVLFIGMTSHGSAVNWLMEVQAILDKNRCPIVQIIDDDKAVHVVAAVNLYESVPETGVTGLAVCSELVEKEVGCAIGMALGSTFCGVTGSSTVAVRWDITGPPAVRAARLMQYAVKRDVAVAIDHSVYCDGTMAAARMEVLDEEVNLKGSDKPIPVYTISDSRRVCAFRVLETVYGRSHDDLVHEIHEHLVDNRRAAVVVTGGMLAGKKIVCQRAAGRANLVPYLHVSDESDGFLQLAMTMATWFQYVDNDDVRYLADRVQEHMEKDRYSRAHDCCVELVDIALEHGFNACFLVDRVQFLDEFSISLIRECLHGRDRRNRRRSSSFSGHGSDSSPELPADAGSIAFLAVHVSFYHWRSAADIVEDITRRSLSIPIVMVGEASKKDLRSMFEDMADLKPAGRWIDLNTEQTGQCAGYFVEKAAGIRRLTGELWSAGKKGYIETTKKLVINIPAGAARAIRQIPVREACPDVAMHFSRAFDELPPLLQTFCKVLTVSAKNGFMKLPRVVMWEALNDLIADGVESGIFDTVVEELAEMCLVKLEKEGNVEVLSFQCPALGDIAMDVSTPVQCTTIAAALIERLEDHLQDSFKIPFVVAQLHILAGRDLSEATALWKQGYQQFLAEGPALSKPERYRWREKIEDEVRDLSGAEATSILGEGFECAKCTKEPLIDQRFQLLPIYMPPIALGPAGHTLAVIFRNVYHEFGSFNGYDEETVQRNQKDMQSATARYLTEIRALETFLAEHELPVDPSTFEIEVVMIREMAKPATSEAEVYEKAFMVLDELVPNYIENRLSRMHSLVAKLRHEDVPAVVASAEKAIYRAYKAIRGASCPDSKCAEDAAQDALMIMATLNWKPKVLPEFLPQLKYQTVARIRNKVLKRLTQGDLFIFKHQQSWVDLEAFLIATPLLYAAHEPPCENCVEI